MGSFQRSLTVLYAIGLHTYLGLEVDASHIHTPYPRCTTLLFPSLPLFHYGTITLLGKPFQATSRRKDQRLWEHHISYLFLNRIQFALCCFRSPLLTASQLISFPTGTKMLQSPVFPLLTELIGSPIKTSPVQRFHTPRRGLSQLGTSFVGGGAKSST